MRASISYKKEPIDEHIGYDIGFEEELNRILSNDPEARNGKRNMVVDIFYF